MKENIEFRPVTPDELPDVLTIYDRARKFMAAHGNPRQWNTTWPPESLLREDIAQGRLLAAVADGEIAAVLVYLQGVDIDPSYRKIENGSWAKGGEYGVVHRLAASGTVPGMGAACLNWAFAQCHHLRVDTHGDNVVMQNLLTKLGFAQRGIIHVVEDNDPRLAYEKFDESAR